MPYKLTGADQERRAYDLNQFIAQNRGADFIEVPSDLVDAPYVIANGVFQTKQAYEQSNQLKQQVASGQMKNIGTPERPLYVPVGSAADVLQQRKGQVTQSFKNTKIQDDLNAFPDKKANRQFVDALFKEKYGRKATESEWRMIDGRTVSDATSFVLGTGQKNGDIVVLPKDLTDISILPDFIKNSDVFKALSPKNQELVAIQWNGIQATSALDKIRINEALKEATKLADPLFKQSILLARDTLERNLANTLATNKEAKDQLETELSIMKEDFVTKSSRLNEAQREAALKDLETISIVKDQAIREGESREAGVAAEVGRINRRITAINEDLKLGRGDIAVEEQAQLARYLKDYQRTLQTTQEQAVDAGLGFSSIRTEAEKRLAEDLQDVSESTRRQKARELRSLENQAGRETSELVATQADIDRKNREMRVDLAKQMEQKLGYAAVPDDIRKYLPGPTIIDKEGTVLRGEAERVQQERARELQQKEEDIKTSTKRAEADAQRQRQILEREREKSVTEQKRKAEEVLGSKKAQEILPGGPTPIGGIIGTLEQQQAEKIQTIGKSLFDTGFYPEEKK